MTSGEFEVRLEWKARELVGGFGPFFFFLARER